jgi:bifunctional non-homologous end joining protein LigD
MIHDSAIACSRWKWTSRQSKCRVAPRGSHWIEARLVGEVAFTEFTREATLRHPSFIALREDKPAGRWCARSREDSQAAKAKKRDRRRRFGIKISNPDRSSTRARLTKGDLADYYARIESLMLVDTARRRSA